MADPSKPQVKTCICRVTYRLKDGTLGHSDQVKTYTTNGKPRGRPKTEESILIAEIKKLSDKHRKKVTKYIEKLKERDKEEEEDEDE